MLATISTAFCADDAISPKMRELWENPITNSRIENGIRANRMGEFRLNFDSPVEDLKINLDRHEFLFGVYASRSVCKGQKIEYTQEQIDTYAKLYKRIFNYGTVAVVWRRVEPQQGKFHWDYSNDANIDLSYMSNPTVMQPDVVLQFCNDNDIIPKASYRALEKLISEDWQTRVSYEKPTQNAHFEGFYGMYEVSYKYKGKEYKQKVWFGKKSNKVLNITAVPTDWRKHFRQQGRKGIALDAAALPQSCANSGGCLQAALFCLHSYCASRNDLFSPLCFSYIHKKE